MQERKKLGEIFSERGILSPLTVERMLALAERSNRRFGTVVEELGLVSGEEMAAALAEQYGCKVVKGLCSYSYPPQLLELLTPDIALRHLLFPLKIDNGKLALAMADPTDTRIVENIAANNDLSIVPFVAPRQEILAAICRFYLGQELTETTQPTVLLAESDELAAILIRDLLVDAGYQVLVTNDGMEAYRQMVTKRPHLLLTARELPLLDGFGLFAGLQALPDTKFIPAILLGDSPEDEARAFNQGFFDVIAKPANEITITTRVRRALQSQGHRPQTG